MNLVFASSHFRQLRKANYVLHCSVSQYVLCTVHSMLYAVCHILYAVSFRHRRCPDSYSAVSQRGAS